MDHAAALTRRRLASSTFTLGPLIAAACALPLGGADSGRGEPAPSIGKATRPGKFTFMEWWTPLASITPYMKEATAQWKARRPELELELVAATPGDIHDKFVTLSAGGSPVDASFMNVHRARDLYDTGQLKDLDALVKQAPDVADDKFLKASEPPRKARGKTFGIPVMGPESWSLIINGNLFRAEGLNPQGSEIKTWDDLARIAQQLTRRSGEDIIRSGFLMPAINIYQFTGWVNTNGPGLFDAEQTKAYYSATTTAATLQFLNRLYDGLRVGLPLSVPNRPNVPGAIIGGQAAIMVENTSSLTTRYQDTPADFQFWLIPFPKGPSGRGPDTATWMNPVVFAKEAKNPERAFEFVRWFCGDAELAFQRFEMVNLVSPLRAFFQASRWQARVKERPVLGTIQLIAELPGAYPYRRVAAQNEEIVPLLQNAFIGRVEIKNALDQAQAIADRVLSG